jgi:hypothetical protein
MKSFRRPLSCKLSAGRRTGNLDWSYIHDRLGPLAELKDAPEILDQLEARRTEFER